MAEPDQLDEAVAAGPLEEAWAIFDERHLPYRVLMLGKMIDRLSVHHVRDKAGVSLAEWRVLAHLAVMGSKSASDVSSAALVDRAEVSRAVRLLETAGLILRADNPRNRKSSLLELTEAGRALYERAHTGRQIFFDMLTVDLSDEEKTIVDGLLLRIARRADQMSNEISEGQASDGQASDGQARAR